jgi:hypothetical protein
MSDIFIRPRICGQSLRAFADEVFRWLHMPFEERAATANQAESIYYFGTAAGIEVAISEQ